MTTTTYTGTRDYDSLSKKPLIQILQTQVKLLLQYCFPNVALQSPEATADCLKYEVTFRASKNTFLEMGSK